MATNPYASPASEKKIPGQTRAAKPPSFPTKSFIAIGISYLSVAVIALSVTGLLNLNGWLGFIVLVACYLCLPAALCLYALDRRRIKYRLFVRIHMWGTIAIGGLITVFFLLNLLGVFGAWAHG